MPKLLLREKIFALPNSDNVQENKRQVYFINKNIPKRRENIIHLILFVNKFSADFNSVGWGDS